MSQHRPRVATIVLVEPDGRVIGRLPSLSVATPWWQDMALLIPIIALFYRKLTDDYMTREAEDMKRATESA